MTALAITPIYEKKRLKLAGTVAAGEHVAVTIVGGGAWIGTGKALRLRVICGARTVAKFPFWTEDNAEDWPEDVTSADAWDSANEGADATCVLNLNTVPAAKLLRYGGMCLWVLDDAENHTLYGSGEYIVEPWPKERGEDEPYYLDEYPDIIAELGERIDAAEESISGVVDEANGIVAYVTAARNDAQTAAQTAGVARSEARMAQGKAEDAQVAAEAAQAAVEAALPLDATLAIQGKAADAKAVGDAISSAIATVVDSAPEAFDTLKEIADWIEDDQSGAAAMAAAIEGKVDKVSGKGLSANDYTDAEKSKLAGIAAGAQVNPTPIAPANATESGMFADAYWTKQDLAGKADKVANAVDGHLAGLDGNGNLTDSGCTPSEFATASSLAAVAFSGDYGDLANTPTIPEFVQVQSDWDEADTSDPSYIQNKPTALSDFTDDVGYVTDVSDKLDSVAASPAYSASQDYTYGDTVTFEGRRYMCIASISISGGDTAVDPPDDVIHWTEWTIDGSLGDKADKVPSASSGDFAGLDSNGNLTDSGYAPTDFAAASALSGKADKVSNVTSGNIATLDSNGNLVDGGYSPSDFALAMALVDKADKVANATNGNLAALDGYGNLVDSGKAAGDFLPKTGGTVNGDLEVGDIYNLANLQVRGDATIGNTMYASTLELQPMMGEYLDFAYVNGAWVLRLTHNYGSTDIVLPFADGTAALLQHIAPDFSTSGTYAEGDLCVYENALYRCTTAVTSAGAWTGSTNWTAASVDDVLAALRTAIAGKQDALSAAQLANIAAVPNKADASALRYDLASETVINTASQETVEGETVNYGAATLADRTGNRVSITAALDELRITFPPAVSGKLRDFGLRVEVGTGSAALTAPALVPVAPTGETIKLENNAKQIPALADGEAEAKGVTLLYISESAPGVFFAKGEQVGEVA